MTAKYKMRKKMVMGRYGAGEREKGGGNQWKEGLQRGLRGLEMDP